MPQPPETSITAGADAGRGATSIAWTGAIASPAHPIAAAKNAFCMISPSNSAQFDRDKVRRLRRFLDRPAGRGAARLNSGIPKTDRSCVEMV